MGTQHTTKLFKHIFVLLSCRLSIRAAAFSVLFAFSRFELVEQI